MQNGLGVFSTFLEAAYSRRSRIWQPIPPYNLMQPNQLFSLLLSLLLVLLLNGQTEAGSIPTLTATAKRLPQTVKATKSSTAAQPTGRIVSLGQKNSITPVKRRVARSSSNSGRTGGKKPSPLPKIDRHISSKSVMVMDGKTGETIFARSPDAPRQPASTIKVLTGILAINSLDNEELVSVSRKAAQMPSSKMYLDPKKKYRADDLINAVLLASANDASVAIAEKIGGSEKAFARMMTLIAKLWGAKNTVCQTASGLTAKGQYSTARDLAIIFRRAMLNEEFAQRMFHRKMQTAEGQTLYNHNKALWRIKGTKAGKTGYTAKARQTYVGQFSRDGATIIVAVMGSETMWGDIKRLVDYGFKRKKQIQLAQTEMSAGGIPSEVN